MIQIHGGNYYHDNDLLDFSANINPLGMPEHVREAVIRSACLWEQYPDPDCTALVRKLSEVEQIPENQIVCGNGAADLIYRIVQAFRPERALICAPSFGEYDKALHDIHCRIDYFYLHPEENFSLTDRFLSEIKPGTDMLFLCSPNNPTGRVINHMLLKQIADICLKRNILCICDECFLDFCDGISMKTYLNRNIMILKAFTKIFAMPGLRLGYLLAGSPEDAARVGHSGQYWSVSAPAQAAGLAALKEQEFISKTRQYIRTEKTYLMSEFEKLNIRYFPSDVNFILFCSEPGLDDLLLKERILIRNCQSYHGLSDSYFRTAVRTHEENQRLLCAVRRCLHG